jgi:glucose-1-phosphate thymidylyltransferase
MKGIILAGGNGSRLYPVTSAVTKQLLPVYDKPMIYYPISTLMLAKIREVLIITTPLEIDRFRVLLGDGSKFGMSFTFIAQKSPRGIVDAFLIGEKFVGTDSIALILGDNIFYGPGLGGSLSEYQNPKGANLFAYKVANPSEYGVIEFNEKQQVISIDEKPKNPKSNFAVTGLFFYDNSVLEVAKSIMPSARGELEITALNNDYLEQGNLSAKLLSRGIAWFDTGSVDELLAASSFIKTIQTRQGINVSSPEEIAWRNGWINSEQLYQAATVYINSPYGNYLQNLLSG